MHAAKPASRETFRRADSERRELDMEKLVSAKVMVER